MVVDDNSPSARMQILSRGQLPPPAQCMVCGNSDDDRGFINLGVFYDYEGYQLLCNQCMQQACEVMGFYTPDEVKHLQDLNESLALTVAEQEKELNVARPFMAAISEFVGTSNTIDVHPGDSIATYEPPSSDSIKPDVDDPVKGPDTRKSKSEKPTPFPDTGDFSGAELRNSSSKATIK